MFTSSLLVSGAPWYTTSPLMLTGDCQPSDMLLMATVPGARARFAIQQAALLPALVDSSAGRAAISSRMATSMYAIRLAVMSTVRTAAASLLSRLGCCADCSPPPCLLWPALSAGREARQQTARCALCLLKTGGRAELGQGLDVTDGGLYSGKALLCVITGGVRFRWHCKTRAVRRTCAWHGRVVSILALQH